MDAILHGLALFAPTMRAPWNLTYDVVIDQTGSNKDGTFQHNHRTPFQGLLRILPTRRTDLLSHRRVQSPTVQADTIR